MQWRAYQKLSNERYPKQWVTSCYCAFPWRTVSRCWGWLADKQMPEWIRPYMYGLYTFTFGVDITEAANEDYKSYCSLSDFFCRPLKEGARVVDDSSCLVAPCDGTVLHFGTVNSGCIEQVKGVTYTLESFLGENVWNKTLHNGVTNYQHSLLHNKLENSKLYHCIIYLAPGDYHRFHSPTDWQPTLRRHFPGQLLSVNPRMAKWLPGLFCINERAIYLGRWAYGFFALAAIGATNVGSIKIYSDKCLQTNIPNYKQRGEVCKDKFLGGNLQFVKGDAFGEFRMGSTIVLIFEAPSNFQFNLVAGQRVKMGQSISNTTKEKYVDRVYQVQRTKMVSVN
ncbi:hypothetical protein FQR65_LT12939 [Abscondita terminalis]|nr:hypothetical protein FQR65_LT12939 [Abscondita terminalis]